MARDSHLMPRRGVLQVVAGGLGVALGSATASASSPVAVSTGSPQSVSDSSAALWGSLDEMTDVDSVDLTFEYRERGASSWNTTRTETFESTGSVRHYLDGLSSGTTYEYRLTATAADGSSDTGSAETVTTDSSATLKASTGAASDVTDTTAVLNGSVDQFGDSSTVDVFFRWGPAGQSGDFPPDTTLEEELTSTGSYSVEIDGLDPSATYEYWLVSDSGLDVDRGSREGFTTTGPQLAVETERSSDASDASLTFNGELLDVGEADSADVAFEYRQSDESAWTETSRQTLSGPGPFSATVDGLSEDTEFDVRAVASASDGDTDTGEVVVAHTTGDPDVVTLEPTNVSDTSVRFLGHVRESGGSDFDEFFEWGPAGDLSNTATDIFYVTRLGSSDFAADISGLDPGTTYEYRAVVEADDGDSDTGSVVSVTTDSVPEVDSFSVSAGTKGPHASITADWEVSDSRDALDSVTVEVVDGSVVDSATTDVSGGTASGSDGFKIKHGANTTYDVTVTVTNTDGSTASETRTVTPS